MDIYVLLVLFLWVLSKDGLKFTLLHIKILYLVVIKTQY